MIQALARQWRLPGLLFFLSCLLNAAALADTAVITNQLAGTVTLHDARTGELLKRLPMDGKPVGVAVDQQHALAYISRPERGLVSVIDLHARAAQRDISLPGGAVAIALNDGARLLAISDWYDEALHVYDTRKQAFVTRVALEWAPAGVVWGDGALYVAERDGDRVAVVSQADWRITERINTGGHPFGLAYDSARQRLYTADVVTGTVTVIDTATSRVLATIAVDESPYCIAISQRHNRVYVTNQLEDTISVIDADSLRVVDTFDTDSYPEGINLTDEDTTLLVANWGDSTLIRLDALTGERLHAFDGDDGSRAVGQFIFRE